MIDNVIGAHLEADGQINISATADAIAMEVSKRIPTLEQYAGISDPGDMGPDVTIPAIWMSLLLTHRRLLSDTLLTRDAELRLKELQASGSLPRQVKPATAEDVGNYAGALGDHAIRTFDGDRLEAASVVFQAGVAVAMTALPKEGVIAAIDNLVEFFDLHAVLGVGRALQ